MRRLFLLISSILLALSLTVSGAIAQSTPEPTIQELQERIEELEEENEELREENERLKQRIDDMSAPSRTPREGSSSTDSSDAPVLQVGETWTSNEWSITVTYVEVSPSLVSSYETNNARGVYIIVHLTVVNEGTAPAEFPYGDLVIMDSDGRSYSIADDALFNLTYVVMGAGGQYDEMQPGLPYNTGVIFDIPATSTGLILTSGGQVFYVELD